MTIPVPPTEAVNDISIKDKTPIVDEQKHTTTPVTTAVIERKDVEPTLTTQVEPPLAATTVEGEESPLASTSTEDKPKRKGLFNNPFANKVKKDSEEAITTLNDTAETSENKISKGFGNFLSKVKQTASSNNIKELSDPTPPTTAEGDTVHEREVVHENTTTAADTTETHDLDNNVNNNNNKRQSILSKLFGGGNNNNANKKKEEATTAAEETDRSVEPDTTTTTTTTTTTDHHQAETEETSPSSPPLSRRVTGFFAKKIPKLDKKQKSSTNTEKVETATSPTTEAIEDKNVAISAEEPHAVTGPTPVTAAKEVDEGPVVKVTETTPVDTTTTNNNATTA